MKTEIIKAFDKCHRTVTLHSAAALDCIRVGLTVDILFFTVKRFDFLLVIVSND